MLAFRWMAFSSPRLQKEILLRNLLFFAFPFCCKNFPNQKYNKRYRKRDKVMNRQTDGRPHNDFPSIFCPQTRQILNCTRKQNAQQRDPPMQQSGYQQNSNIKDKNHFANLQQRYKTPAIKAIASIRNKIFTNFGTSRSKPSLFACDPNKLMKTSAMNSIIISITFVLVVSRCGVFQDEHQVRSLLPYCLEP